MFPDHVYRQLLTGTLIGGFIAFLISYPDAANVFLDSVQKIVVIIGTLFTANWTYKTFGYDPKRDEVFAISKVIREITENIDNYKFYSERLEEDHEEEFKKICDEKLKEVKKNMEELTSKLTGLIKDSIYVINGYKELCEKIEDEDLNAYMRSWENGKPDCYDELRMLLQKLNTSIREDTFYIVENEVKKVKKYFGF
jgi:hypothetical protein